ncbi:MAG: [FeFe] hydrogenase H-cluster maturation GTPase HydF [Bacteroidales bacterium]|nr:[FeFe] hydrogenase H-cluster maturation GTPase HydF [Bacteroidales bacterium]
MSKGKASTPFIGVFGRRNNGKSSLVNALAGQEVSIVSEVAGTTTDPVRKTIEIGGLGPVMFVDTAGIDDIGGLGEKRVARTIEIIKTIDLAILIITRNTFGEFEKNLAEQFREYHIPFFIVHNKSDIAALYPETRRLIAASYKTDVVDCSLAGNQEVIPQLLGLIRKYIPENAWKPVTLIGDLISYGDTVLLITPIDIEAPEGRLILPQVQVIRDVLDNDGIAVICKEREIDSFLKKMNPKPSLVITDSQVFLKADASVPRDIPLTSFSIILARQKGDFANYIKGTPHISNLKDGDRILVLESCSHHVSCDDIGRVKIPRWLSNFTGKKLEYEVVAGLNAIPGKITDYAMVIQCGGCMITRKQLINRLKPAVDAGIPVTNYGMAIAYVHGIYNRAIAPFTDHASAPADYL